MVQFKFIPADIWSQWEELTRVSFFGNSGSYFKLPDGEVVIIYDGYHVASIINKVIYYNPKLLNLPYGFKSAVTKLLTVIKLSY